MDKLSIIGVLIAIVAIVFGQYLEGGSYQALLNGPALLIVGGGTLGAVMLQTPYKVFKELIKITPWVLFPPLIANKSGIDCIINWGEIARKNGLLELEHCIDQVEDKVVKQGLELLIDGNSPETIRQILQVDANSNTNEKYAVASVYESMAGYSPTIGIIGAVIGLIQVLNNMAEPANLGSGIAVAFIATVYGVGFANLLFLPVARKLSTIIDEQSNYREMMIEGLVSIAAGQKPRMIKIKLLSFI